jgi:hypothetical protein
MSLRGTNRSFVKPIRQIDENMFENYSSKRA